jgi:membrane associated rhomboid family serine protease
MASRAMVVGEARALGRSVASGAKTLAAGTGLLWALELVDSLLLGGRLDAFGIRPLAVDGLLGILTAPFLHGGLGHLAVNTVPFLVLGALTMTRKRVDFWVVSIVGALTSGLGAWVFGGAGTVHIGASGVIFAYLGFLMARGFFDRRPLAIVVSLLVTWMFGGLLSLAVPLVAAGISWQAHLFGFVGGVLVARVLGKELAKKAPRKR